MKNFMLSVLVLFFISPLCGQEKLLPPSDFLGYELGDRFTLHEQTAAYFRHVAGAMPNAEMYSYGMTFEGRPLFYLVITSPENFQNLEDIRASNLRRTGLVEGVPSPGKTAVIWLSYNVHGNEASTMEAAMMTLYELANPGNAQTQQWLKNTVVIIDPCINPDGRDRYANFYNQYGNKPPNPNVDALEHHEPWPGGRSNHYFFDLNRDWAWITQAESRQRLKAYHHWMPHVHVDFHEQGHNHPYYFAPAAEPLHEVISGWQREFQVMIGKNNARHFDEKGWLYFTKEVFDLYYPSYGDTYPTYNGAVGMTYEQAGGGIGGLEITTHTGDALTLKDRLTHHHTSALSTIETTSRNAGRLVDEFGKYFRENNANPATPYKTYVIKGDNNADHLRQLTAWMDAHAIRYGHPAASKASRGYNYQTHTISPVDIGTDDIIVSALQPKSRFITAIFEPASKLSDSLTYDITAWNLIHAYNLDAWALTEKIPVARKYEPQKNHVTPAVKPYAYIFKYRSIEDVAFLATLMQHNVKVRAAQKAFVANGETFGPGSLIITRRNNEGITDLDELVTSLAGEGNRKVYTVTTGFVQQGKDLGSGDLNYLKPPNVAVLFGDETSPLSAGEIWHFFEQQIRFPITQLHTNYFRDVDLRRYDVLIVPDGFYKLFDDPMLEKLSAWINGGGRLILLSNALNAFVDKKGFALSKYASDAERNQAQGMEKQQREQESLLRYDELERKQISQRISGAIYRVAIDNSHPLAFGMRNTYCTLKMNEHRFAFLGNGWNVAYFSGAIKPIQGFAGYKANAGLKDSLLFGVESRGQGQIIYLVDNPLFRSFWESGKLIFANAVFMSGQ